MSTLNQNKIEEQKEDEYDFDDNCQELAKERGQIVVLPEPKELQLDIDSNAQRQDFQERRKLLDELGDYRCFGVPSKSGGEKSHIYIEIARDKPLDNWERLALQAALGDDPTRAYLNTRRLASGEDHPSRLFEAPDFVRKYPAWYWENVLDPVF